MVNQMNARSLLSLFTFFPKSFGLALLIWAATMMPVRAQKSVELRVAIEKDVPQVNVGSSVNAQVLDGAQRVVGEIQGMNGFAAQVKNGGVALDRWQSGALWIVPKDKNGVVWIGNRWYRGRVYLVPTGKGLTAVNYVDLEQYLFSVLGAEMNGNWPQEALKAQAVAARSYALHERQNARNGIFDLGDTQGWQVYNGLQSESTGTQQAVLATTGQVLTHNNRVINAVFHSSAGGCTENVEDVWVQALPYLRTVRNNFDQGSPVNEWSKTFTTAEIGTRFGVGNLQRMEPVKTTPVCGRVQSMRIVGDRGSKVVDGDAVRSALGLRSTLFTVAPQFQPVASKGGQKQAVAGFVINGRGFGHGLGMSQWGAYNMARQNYNYQQILQQYYLNTALAQIQVQ
ncbi:SpoIID/LytB domain-containing protein [Cyanobacteria bacterium FACHB-DQ100]|uniref:SpoIID/LytB domain-containing protein n=1 Tax=unclassified Leptolyngbya TaxID=2650499 RepID=UPI001680ECD9|nr:SpoIID/LytB domain-containing protein [Leptolyngbya sp. FACHB-17]MBD1823955.1 SpoIID/LytB domain-containing protein [Cyanobacteria bacterium FACHB-DQ100]MBD2082827.1 SpoIID/LytB domain-containing protein [Leptolyngbya sp. FACHB-17]